MKSPYKTRLFGIGIVYCLIFFPRIWVVKIGYSGVSAKRRARSVSKHAPGFAFPVAIAVIPFAWHVEQGLHSLFAGLSYRFYKGDGSTECFLFPAHIVCLMLFQVMVWEFLLITKLISYEYF